MINDYSVIYNLPMKWSELTEDAFDNKKFDCDSFLDVFRKTFDVLRKYSCKECVDREVVCLITEVSAFASTKPLDISYDHLAACELTTAMLYNCFYLEFFSEHEIPKTEITKGEWCFLPGASVEVDFTDPENELFNFAWELEEWDSMPTASSNSDDLDKIG